MKEVFDKLGLTDRIVDYGGLNTAACISALAMILEKALGQRIHYMQFALQDIPMVWINMNLYINNLGARITTFIVKMYTAISYKVFKKVIIKYKTLMHKFSFDC